MKSSPRTRAALLWCALLAGCTNLPSDHGRSQVEALLAAQGVDTAALASASQPAAQNGHPLDLNEAVHVALVNNPELRARFAELGFAAADVYDAGRLSNPTLSLAYLFVEDGNLDNEKSVGLTQSFTELILLPARTRLAEADFSRVQHAVAGAVQQLASAVAHAWYALAGATEVAAMQAEVADTARLSGELAERFFAAGNINRRELAEIRAGAAAARLEALQAEDHAAAARAALIRLIGTPLPADARLAAAGLPVPETTVASREALLAQADRSRLDLAAARQAVALRADALGVTRQFRFLGGLELGPQWTWNEDGMRSVGPALAIELPIFNHGTGKVARAEADLALADAALAALELDTVNEIERARAALRNAQVRFEQYRDLLRPLQQEIVARRQAEVNFMLEGPFTLLEAKQDEYRAASGMLEAARDYWLARVDLARATGQPPTAAAPAAERLTARQLAGTADASTSPQHVHHMMGPDAHPMTTPHEPDAAPASVHQHHGDHP